MTETTNNSSINPESFPKIGGIPIDLAQIAQFPEHKVIVKASITEDQVSIYADQNRVEILDLDEPQVGLDVEFYDFPDNEDEDPEQITNRISINVRTIIERNDRRYKNPDFRAKELTLATIEYFESLHGPINSIMFDFPGGRYIQRVKYSKGEFLDPSDNFVAYFSAKDAELAKLITAGISHEEALEKAKIAGAKASWSYREIATPRGLTRVRNVFEAGIEENIEATVSGEFVRELKVSDSPSGDES